MQMHRKPQNQILLLSTAPAEPFPSTAQPAGTHRATKAPNSDFTHCSLWSTGKASMATSHHVFLRSSQHAFIQTQYQTAIFYKVVYENTTPEWGSTAPMSNAELTFTTSEYPLYKKKKNKKSIFNCYVRF